MMQIGFKDVKIRHGNLILTQGPVVVEQGKRWTSWLPTNFQVLLNVTV